MKVAVGSCVTVSIGGSDVLTGVKVGVGVNDETGVLVDVAVGVLIGVLVRVKMAVGVLVFV